MSSVYGVILPPRYVAQKMSLAPEKVFIGKLPLVRIDLLKTLNRIKNENEPRNRVNDRLMNYYSFTVDTFLI